MVMNQEHMVLTAVGPDRPGLVEDIAALIHQHGCNLEDSRMAILAGEFAIVLLFSGTSEAVGSMRSAGGTALESELGFRVAFRATTARDGQPTGTMRLRVSGADQPGIVRRVSAIVAREGVNVASFESRLEHAAFSGTPIFRIDALLQLPTDAAIESIRAGLREACDALNLTFSLDAAES